MGRTNGAVNATLSASEPMIIKARRVSLALYPTLLNLSLSAILRNFQTGSLSEKFKTPPKGGTRNSNSPPLIKIKHRLYPANNQSLKSRSFKFQNPAIIVSLYLKTLNVL